MRIFPRLFGKQPRRFEIKGGVPAVVAVEAALRHAIETKGWADHNDCKHLPISRRRRFWAIAKLVEQGRFRKEGTRIYTNIDLKNVTPENSDDILDSGKTFTGTTAELLEALPKAETISRTPNSDTAQAASPPPNKAVFRSVDSTWFELARRLPSSALSWAKELFDAAIRAGNPFETVYLSILNVDFPRYQQERVEAGFRELKRRYPQADAAGYFKLIAQGESPENILRDIEVFMKQQQRPRNATGRPREVADPEKWHREQEQDLNVLRKNRERPFITMDQESASSFERAITEIIPAQSPPKKS